MHTNGILLATCAVSTSSLKAVSFTLSLTRLLVGLMYKSIDNYPGGIPHLLILIPLLGILFTYKFKPIVYYMYMYMYNTCHCVCICIYTRHTVHEKEIFASVLISFQSHNICTVSSCFFWLVRIYIFVIVVYTCM